ncbi:hypothetical protein OOK39_44150 [Streptomyces sp. NBC_00264]|uniref:hypothetical protein n=1 Tax=unclassified Streptomyces TaxID=2593676 RepID=UPI000F5B8CE6|nr:MULTISPECIES: hypothetical protein [unclassified Streptomyces]WSW99163.1 hypothetical protein OG355_01025 [Streptomyces sp. NBC_00987]MCX4399397.1 hypothetical protein [Streptomyces sp. NBC_01767]MCX5165990.1 hypothetical protein [Streptomyces sp. NBC_00305]MCX5224565.1 hypothetical protein [Streptomyces sp. NBC_00264]RPK62051.1 hypothetical protein EES42_31030 [Streptomyces sp. ADI95-17]
MPRSGSGSFTFDKHPVLLPPTLARLIEQQITTGRTHSALGPFPHENSQDGGDGIDVGAASQGDQLGRVVKAEAVGLGAQLVVAALVALLVAPHGLAGGGRPAEPCSR